MRQVALHDAPCKLQGMAMQIFDAERDAPQYLGDRQGGSVGGAVLLIVVVVIAASWLLGG